MWQREADLLQVVLALGPGGGLADLLHGGQQQADQDGDDRDDHQQLDERERGTDAGLHHTLLLLDGTESIERLEGETTASPSLFAQIWARIKNKRKESRAHFGSLKWLK